MARTYRSGLYRSIISLHDLVPRTMGILTAIEYIGVYIVGSLNERSRIVPSEEGSVLVSLV